MNTGHCVLTGMFLPNSKIKEYRSWCGRTVNHHDEWFYQDASHVALCGRQNNFPSSVCINCKKLILESIQKA